MRFLLDHDVYAATARFLRDLGHEVVQVAHIGLAQAEDEDLLTVAQTQGRLFVTRDRDFGGLVFVNALGAGVLYLRILPSTQNAVHRELERVLTTYSEEELRNAFVVIEPGGHRFRKLTRKGS
jgi:predicted nuclease of predicted toxin-antitoxin system